MRLVPPLTGGVLREHWSGQAGDTWSTLLVLGLALFLVAWAVVAVRFVPAIYEARIVRVKGSVCAGLDPMRLLKGVAITKFDECSQVGPASSVRLQETWLQRSNEAQKSVLFSRKYDVSVVPGLSLPFGSSWSRFRIRRSRSDNGSISDVKGWSRACVDEWQGDPERLLRIRFILHSERER